MLTAGGLVALAGQMPGGALVEPPAPSGSWQQVSVVAIGASAS